MGIIDTFSSSFMHPPILFFLLGILAVLVKSDLKIPVSIGKFLSLYLLFCIGLKGGQALFAHGFTPTSILILTLCIVISFVTPLICYFILKFKLNIYDAGAIAASYGSVSAVTFITATEFLEENNIPYDSVMISGLALMEVPAIITGLIIIKLLSKDQKSVQPMQKLSAVIHEAVTNGYVFILIGSMVIGYLGGIAGEIELKPFTYDIFKGMLCLYLLDMGIIAGSKLTSLRQFGVFLSSFALIYPLVAAMCMIIIAKLAGISAGNALLFTILGASASYIAAPAAMRFAVPQVNMGLLLPMVLGITFTFNIIFGIPLYNYIIQRIWI